MSRTHRYYADYSQTQRTFLGITFHCWLMWPQ